MTNEQKFKEVFGSDLELFNLKGVKLVTSTDNEYQPICFRRLSTQEYIYMSEWLDEEYMPAQIAEDDHVVVGDEITAHCVTGRLVVVNVSSCCDIQALSANGNFYNLNRSEIKKTGRHFRAYDLLRETLSDTGNNHGV